ncbi:hypothetical protein TUZN_0203 [Thermoproteus uzoniensis 768-20]|uniref:Uncharacterized protein n=1 Tax=Thermoproteus uzoniensis (strain 768-20) TaxID=999630 RepID=F2L1W1_THEU7|nr:hypothetical protein TUZN_0203 [Thermoproteus uzoniensis 768-20]
MKAGKPGVNISATAAEQRIGINILLNILYNNLYNYIYHLRKYIKLYCYVKYTIGKM